MQALLKEKDKAQESMMAELKRKEVEMKKEMEKQKVWIKVSPKSLFHKKEFTYIMSLFAVAIPEMQICLLTMKKLLYNALSLYDCILFYEAEMEEAQKKLEKEMREQYEEQLKDKEDSLVARLVEEQEKLKDERQALEERLREKTEGKLCFYFPRNTSVKIHELTLYVKNRNCNECLFFIFQVKEISRYYRTLKKKKKNSTKSFNRKNLNRSY